MTARSEANRDSFTTAEHIIANVVSVLISLHNLYSLPRQHEKTAVAHFVNQALEDLGAWLIKCKEIVTWSIDSGICDCLPLAPDLAIPSWNLYHNYYAHLEQCMFIRATLKFVLSENKKEPIIDQQKLAVDVKEVLDRCMNLSSAVSRAALLVLKNIQSEAFLHGLRKAATRSLDDSTDENLVVEELESLSRGPVKEKVMRNLRDSWVEGLEGVLRTKFA